MQYFILYLGGSTPASPDNYTPKMAQIWQNHESSQALSLILWSVSNQGLQCICYLLLTWLEKAMAPHSSALAWKIPWMEEPGRLQSMGSLRDFTFPFYFHALEKEMATHSCILAWTIPGTVEPGGLPSMGSHRVGHWSNLAAVAHMVWFSGFPGVSVVKDLPARQEMQIQSLSWEDTLEKAMATHCSILAWKIPCTQEPGGL